MLTKRIFGFFCFFILFLHGSSQVNFTGEKLNVTGNCAFVVDSNRNLLPADIEQRFKAGRTFPGKIDLDYSPYPIWIRLSIRNKSDALAILAVFENPLIDSVEIFRPGDITTSSDRNWLGEGMKARKFRGTFQKFLLQIPKNEEQVFYMRVCSSEQLVILLTVGSAKEMLESSTKRDLIYGAFMGVVLVMLFYNLFIYLSTRDRNYLYYVLYILFIGLGQISMSGHMFSLILGSAPSLYKYCIVVMPALSGVFGVIFVQHFLQGQVLAPKLNKFLFWIAAVYGLAGLVRLGGYDQISARIMDGVGIPAAAIIYTLAFKVYRNGFRSAIYFIFAWSIFILGVLFFVMRNLGVLPFNAVTTYTLPFGAAMEVALLSFALADKINVLQKQKREKEKEALEAALENERLIREQNVILEGLVKERTHELEESNTQLSDTLDDLKSTQMQLVEQEKMASLGQLTAGIAHEINNPINFVTSNINPLKRDIGMLRGYMNNLEAMSREEIPVSEKLQRIAQWKEEIEFEYLEEEMNFLLRGIDEGANRTAQIVKGLRIFARDDEDVILPADIAEGIESALVIMNNQMAGIEVQRNYTGPVICDCYPGKLNQVFLNLISNAIFAIGQRFNGESGGVLKIDIKDEGEHLQVIFEDNGSGMSEEVQKKVFEPFFTTKPVGQGTGLGMSIVFKTIEMHKGTITVWSKEGEGSRINIALTRKLV